MPVSGAVPLLVRVTDFAGEAMFSGWAVNVRLVG